MLFCSTTSLKKQLKGQRLGAWGGQGDTLWALSMRRSGDGLGPGDVGVSLGSGDPGHPVLIPHPTHHLPSLLALAVRGEGAEGRGGHWLAAQPHVVCLPGQARVNIQLGFCFAGTRGTWQHWQCSWGWGFARPSDVHSGRECFGLCPGNPLSLLLQPTPALFLNVLAGS